MTERPFPVTLPGAVDAFLVERASAIRVLGKRMARDIIEIGRLLTECQDRVGHGGWAEWLKREFGWTDRTALNFMRVHAMAAKSENFSDLPIDASALYLLARPSTADDIRHEVIERAANGETISQPPSASDAAVAAAWLGRPREPPSQPRTGHHQPASRQIREDAHAGGL